MIIDPYRRGVSDPEFANVVLLLHGDGANDSTTFTDHSSYARSVPRELSVLKISTAQSKFGGASIFGNGSDQLTCSMGSEFVGRNWCIETWARRAASYDRFGVFYVNTNLFARIDGTAGAGTYKFQFALNGSVFLESAAAVPADTWTHLRVSCEQGAGVNNTVRLFVNGVLDASSGSTSGNLDLPGAVTFSIGRHDPAGFRGVNGYLDDYRFTLATRETGNFSVPTAPYPDA